jgi:hypothetical protein
MAAHNHNSTEPIQSIESFFADSNTPDFIICPISNHLKNPVLLPHSGVIVSKLVADIEPGFDVCANVPLGDKVFVMLLIFNSLTHTRKLHV